MKATLIARVISSIMPGWRFLSSGMAILMKGMPPMTRNQPDYGSGWLPGEFVIRRWCIAACPAISGGNAISFCLAATMAQVRHVRCGNRRPCLAIHDLVAGCFPGVHAAVNFQDVGVSQ